MRCKAIPHPPCNASPALARLGSGRCNSFPGRDVSVARTRATLARGCATLGARRPRGNDRRPSYAPRPATAATAPERFPRREWPGVCPADRGHMAKCPPRWRCCATAPAPCPVVTGGVLQRNGARVANVARKTGPPPLRERSDRASSPLGRAGWRGLPDTPSHERTLSVQSAGSDFATSSRVAGSGGGPPTDPNDMTPRERTALNWIPPACSASRLAKGLLAAYFDCCKTQGYAGRPPTRT
jgi:hypothetical protein